MKKELKDAFDILDINDKRNQINKELLLISELIKTYENNKGIKSTFNIKNYNQDTDSNLSENDMLTFMYEDIYNIEQELIILLSLIK